MSIGKPVFSSTPAKMDYEKKLEVSGSTTSYNSSSKGYQKTTVTAKRDVAAPSSYQLRFGNRNRNIGYRQHSYHRGGGSIEASITRVTVSDGLELTPSLMMARADEKAQLGSLNDRFVTYIEKVRGLVQCNQVLEAKVKQLESSRVTPSCAASMYEDTLKNIQREIEKVVVDKTHVEIELENCQRELLLFQKRLEREINDREDAEDEVKSLRKDVDLATLTRVELEGNVESLREEIDLIRRASVEDIRALTDQLNSMTTSDIAVEGSHIDLSESLRDIRAAYEQLTQNNKIEIEQYYKTKINELNTQLKDENIANKESKSNVFETKRQLQSISSEVETLRTNNFSLEDRLEEAENRYQRDTGELQDRIASFEIELRASHDKVSKHLLDYNELLNVKLSLDLEIQTYRQLLEGEEIRIGSQSSVSLEVSGASYNQVNNKSITVEEKTVTVETTKSVQKRQSSKSSSSSSSSSSSDSESEI